MFGVLRPVQEISLTNRVDFRGFFKNTHTHTYGSLYGIFFIFSTSKLGWRIRDATELNIILGRD